MNQQQKEHAIGHRVGNVVGIVVSLILLPILLVNLTLIVKSYINSDEVPSVGGFLPLIVLTDSMYPNIQSGDLIICRTADPESVEVGDVISFFDPDGDGKSVVSHRVKAIVDEDGSLAFQTQGDANNVEDNSLVPAENLVGIYQSRIAGAGNIAIFLQTPTGLVLCVVLPLFLLTAYDIFRERIYERNRKNDTEALLQELEELRSEKGQAS